MLYIRKALGKIILRHICYDGLVIRKYSRNNGFVPCPKFPYGMTPTLLHLASNSKTPTARNHILAVE